MNDQHSLAGRVALVTGGARGIGYAIAQELNRRGASVVIADSGVSIAGDDADPEVAKSAAAALGETCVAFTEDISAAGAAQAAVKLAVERFGGLDLVVNNAAILRDALIFKSERATWERVLQNNLTGAWAVLAAATPVMRDVTKSGRAPGRIVNLTSSAGLYGNVGQSAYASAKAGLLGLTRVVAMEMARSKVSCNAVVPFASTRVTESIQPANEAQASYKARALKVPADYVAHLVAWLCSSACEVTGQVFGVRGREVFLFSQPRPVARAVMPDLSELNPERLAELVSTQLSEQFIDLATDLESFDTEPLI
ncbi:MAG: SDR family NAD(P)-dependent oxidoreductase [Betaproteobacteria bacterium]